ncbi:unnamed protein product [Mycetohabitans rhizoxinica HKI 454]|uniref:Uncharacterized protein n=1 Tax=Mycetohabitans rhizoxinica (strain DSM 19002 / CIP 109453 / HKI 454) TaxID=882378 RepID=E5ANN3_MYCRK|nr:unnamed protein product [Mycetohabitans rhizoxinica HKI 454]
MGRLFRRSPRCRTASRSASRSADSAVTDPGLKRLRARGLELCGNTSMRRLAYARRHRPTNDTRPGTPPWRCAIAAAPVIFCLRKLGGGTLAHH